ncbi:hypothetical protein [Burkholderia ubonensis]|uniref:hypothetical protein n=1 Tax=Burkholderia ubonensis TaxID=101571 RepID=UPI000F5ADBFC|nr:hypothetical protein [Burkholderia ubonensis]
MSAQSGRARMVPAWKWQRKAGECRVRSPVTSNAFWLSCIANRQTHDVRGDSRPCARAGKQVNLLVRVKNISCSDIFLCIPMYSVIVESCMKRVLTERKRMRKMQ